MPNRYVCSALEELRVCLDRHFTYIDLLVETESKEEYALTKQQAFFDTLIEEVQTYVNRMEAGLGDKWSQKAEFEKLADLKRERRILEKKVKILREELEDLKEEDNG